MYTLTLSFSLFVLALKYLLSILTMIGLCFGSNEREIMELFIDHCPVPFIGVAHFQFKLSSSHTLILDDVFHVLGVQQLSVVVTLEFYLFSAIVAIS